MKMGSSRYTITLEDIAEVVRLSLKPEKREIDAKSTLEDLTATARRLLKPPEALGKQIRCAIDNTEAPGAFVLVWRDSFSYPTLADYIDETVPDIFKHKEKLLKPKPPLLNRLSKLICALLGHKKNIILTSRKSIFDLGVCPRCRKETVLGPQPPEHYNCRCNNYYIQPCISEIGDLK
jgi:hypothetical protein